MNNDKCFRCNGCCYKCNHSEDKMTWQDVVRIFQIFGIIFVVAGCRSLFGLNEQPSHYKRDGIGEIKPYNPDYQRIN